MPESTRTLTVTYTDVDAHAGTVSATVCDASDVCEPELSLTKQSGDEATGAVYGIDFTTDLGGTLTATIAATDSYDDAADDRTASFSVDTETPWLKNPSVSSTSAGEADEITFSVVYCVFDAVGTGTGVVDVDVNGDGGSSMAAGASSSDCKNGVAYSLASTVSWAAAIQAVVFSASNDNATGSDVAGDSITINDAPTLVTGSAEKHANDEDFVFNASVSDVNSDDGDTFTVYVTIEADSEREMTCDVAGDCTLTVSESTIIDQMGGLRSVTFRVEDSWIESSSNGFTQTVDVTKTSSFVWVAPANGNFQPGFRDYDFTITNNGNFEDIFTVTASSDNGWVASSSQDVTVAKGVTDSFTITMDVAHVAAGIVDHWSVTVTADNDDTQTGSHDGQTTVASVSGVSVTIGTSTGSELPNGQVNYFFTITNTGNGDEAFIYSTTSQNNWGLAGGAVTTASLAMGASEIITVVHTVSENADSGDSDTITFTSGSASKTATTTAEQNYGSSISFTNSNQLTTLNPGDSFTISYTVINGGNGDDDFSVFFNAPWMTASSGTTLSLAAGTSGTATAIITVPDDSPSGSSSTIAADVTGGGGSSDDAGAAYIMTVADNTRSATVDINSNSYSHNPEGSASGIAIITNTGVSSTFFVSYMDEALSFGTSTITLEAGVSGDLAFTVSAIASGDVNFTVEDTIDGASVPVSFTIIVNTFDNTLLTNNTTFCGESNIVCIIDSAGGFEDGVYTNAGTFFTTMSATDANGMTGTHTFSTTIANAAPSVEAPMSPTDTIAQSEQSFPFAVPTDRDGTITQFVIDFGDGNSVTFDSSDLAGRSHVLAVHAYAEHGEYMISATAYDNSGDSTIQTTTIEVDYRTVTMSSDGFWRNFGVLVFMAALGSFVSVSAFSVQRSGVPEMVHELEALVSEGIDNQEIHDAIQRLNSFQGIPLFSNSISESKKLLSKNKNLKSNIINNMTELSNLREELYKMKNAGMSIVDLESTVHKLELQLVGQAKSDSSIKYLETLQNKFVEEQEFEE